MIIDFQHYISVRLKCYLFVTYLVLSVSITLSSQVNTDSFLTVAFEFSNNNKYEEALDIYKMLRNQPTNSVGSDRIIVENICASYFNFCKDLRRSNQHSRALMYIEEALDLIELESDQLSSFWTKDKKVELIMELIINYVALENYLSARKYQDLLYEYYDNSQLPNEYSDMYIFDIFYWKGMILVGRENYEQLGDSTNEISFAKVIYDVYRENEFGQAGLFLFQLQTVKIHKRTEWEPDYLLSKLLPSESDEIGGGMSEFTYTSPIDYSKLKKDILEVLKGNYNKRLKSNIGN